MRKGALTALMISLCLLTGCGGTDGGEKRAEDLALAIRTELLEMTACHTTAAITADYGQRVYEYTLDVDYDAVEGATLTVVEPAMIAGVTARITKEGATLEYDGASLETGALTGSGLTPLEALPALLEYARSGYMTGWCFETREGLDTLRMTCGGETGDEDGAEAVMWFDVATHAPVAAELYSGGRLVVSCAFSGFTMTGPAG